MADPVNSGWFEEDRIKALKEQFDASGPYTHVVLPELCNQDVLVKARSEIIDNVVAKYKETDLFKVHAPILWYCCLALASALLLKTVLISTCGTVRVSERKRDTSRQNNNQQCRTGVPDWRFSKHRWSGVRSRK